MKKIITFFKKILVLLVLFCLLDYLCGIMLKHLFYNQKSGKYYTTLYGLEHAREDILIFGNSHANEDFNATLMEERLKVSAFNLGNTAQSLLYQYPLIKTVLQKSNPKLIIIVVDYNTLKFSTEDYQNLSILLPFRGYNQYIDSAIATINKKEWYKSYSSLYRYNSAFGYMLRNIYKKTYNKSYESRGFDPMEETLCNKVAEYQEIQKQNTPRENNFEIDSLKIKYLINIIDELQSKKIKIIFVTTPLYDFNFSMHVDNLYFIELKRLLDNKNMTFWDFSKDSSFRNHCELFNDPGHLNRIGANIFTERIIEKIKPMLY